MNRSTKKKLMVLAIVLTFTLSSVAFVVTGITGSASNQQFEPLQGFVIDGDIDTSVESQYIQNGFTFLKYYYSSGVPDYVNGLPDSFATNTGQVQLFVVKIKGGEDFVTISSLNGVREIRNITQESIVSGLCDTLMVVPVECSLMLLQQQNLTA